MPINPQTGEEESEPSGLGAFMHGVPLSGFHSSNVKYGQYNPHQGTLNIGFNNGGAYTYHTGPGLAKTFYDASSKGKFVWDHLRRRGTVYGYQVPYSILGGLSAAGGYQPRYYGTHAGYLAHKAIGMSGHGVGTPEETHMKVPIAQHAPAEEIPMAERATPRRASGGSGVFGKIFRGAMSLFGKHMADGGPIGGDPSRGDNIPIRATSGEYVESKEERAMIDRLLGRDSSRKQGIGGHFAGGGVVNALQNYSQGMVRSAPGYIGGAIGSTLGFGGGLFGALAGGLLGSALTGGRGGGGQVANPQADALTKAGEMLQDAARQLSDAVTQATGQGPAAGSSLSNRQWITNQKGLPQLFKRFGPGSIPTAGAAPDEAGAGAGGSLAAGALAGGAMLAVGAFMKLKDTTMEVVSFFKQLATNPAGVIRSAVSPIQSQVAAYNPATVERFNIAMDNLSASVGRWFSPIIEKATAFGNELNSLFTSTGDFNDLIKQAADGLINFTRSGIVGFIDAGKRLAVVFQPLIDRLPELGSIVGSVVRSLFSMYASSEQILKSFVPFKGVVDASIEALKSFAIQVDVASSYLEDLANLGSPNQSGGNVGSGLATGLGQSMSNITGVSLINALVPALVGGLSREEREQRARDRINSPQSLAGPMTIAAQPARQIGIEQLGQEARASAFSGAIDLQQQTANNTQAAAATLQQIQTLLTNIQNALPTWLTPNVPEM